MSRSNIAIAVLTAGLLSASCASLSVNRIWTDPAARIGAYRSLVVLCACPDTIASRILEDALVRDLSLRGIHAQPAYQVVGRDSMSESEMRASLQAQGADGIIVAKVTGVENRTTYVPGTSYVVPVSHYDSFSHGFNTYFRRVHEPGYFDPYQVLDMQADLYDAQSGKIVTSISTSQTKSSDVNGDMQTFAEGLISRLARVHLLG